MDLTLSYLGFAQSLFAILLMLTKRPLKIAYIIFAIQLLGFALIFGLDILQNYNIIPPHRHLLSLSIRMLAAPLFFLYAKYITKDFNKFNRLDYLHGLPSLILILSLTLLTILFSKNIITNENFQFSYNLLRLIFGWTFFALLLFYIVSAIAIVIRFKKQSKQYYSYESYKISLNWLFVMVIFFVFFILMIIISSWLNENGKISFNISAFRHIVELSYIYILSIWGFHQNQLNSHYVNDSKNYYEKLLPDSSSGKYVRSGLKDEDAINHVQKLIKYMEETEDWKDPEFSIAKLSSKTAISKHKLSEVLNEYLGKNFYIFINEYRVEHAKKLLLKKEYSNWSILAIAYECGFNSKSAFNKFFKIHTQLTPSEYKKSVTE
jgi:Transcriptional regulator containing an amidase domain and an AraC-type DNA-binding HTH domain